MGLFDFLKKNKNRFNTNGTNYIYYDNGKGPIKEKFNKKNGVLDEEYIKYDRNGNFKTDLYVNGIKELTKKEIFDRQQEEQIKLNIEIEIDKLKKIDNLISRVSNVFLLVQMENSKLNDYANFIDNKYNNIFEEDYIKFYLYFKRNYFINYNIEHDISLDKTEKYFNEIFTNNINNYIKNRKNYLTDVKINWSDIQFLKDDIFIKLIGNINTDYAISSCGKGINKSIFNQESILFGLNFNNYREINQLIIKKCNSFNFREYYDEMKTEDLIDDFRDLIDGKLSVTPKNDMQDTYVQNVLNEIYRLCINNKVNQEEIILDF
jgi:hypothetical protein